ncbi:tyrosine-type recombinase/integrase [Burkholderia pseudomallei]|uniref:tyrosine-type recombinase/integrase n=1 Tax=Burkholderia pseudomallei TaxID=28450 RepID=UPI0009765A25|nr:tyrosine-type recombinase/integrase [Burkholderia pseudomallei]OMQ47934.1 integrase [Burkholderia pseudomallei]OMQ64809.1 integrase [Burkholderia pseudomallei]OMQ65203.1 integrase [Burkholderia pseudomallei]CAJ2721990.1 integrase-like protein [Burkholderia pseudomallei]CAJ4664258.1 integrase-like protein [Burkholderia pseudomallei]
MAARRRNADRRSWPPNLYQNPAGYFWFRHPVTGKTFGLGRDFADAAAQVRTVNADIEAKKGKLSLLQRIGGADKTLTQWCDEYEQERTGLKRNTAIGLKSQLNAIRSAPFAGQEIAKITAREVSNFIREAASTRGPASAMKIRSRLRDVFREAIERGLVELGKNPVEVVKAAKPSVTRSRLTLDDFKAILAESQKDASLRWFSNAMLVALVSGQRREDVATMRFDQIKDGFLWVKQTKGKEGHTAKLKIPLSLRLDALNITLDEVLRKCRDNVVSKNVIHFVKRSPLAKAGDAPKLGTITNKFAEVRDAAKIETPAGKTPASFHEIRSLASRLYTEEYGKEFAQALLGHKSPQMTDLYRDVRGREWTEIKPKAS